MEEAPGTPSVHLFGALRVETAGGTLAPPRVLGEVVKAVAVLGPLHAEHLIELVWPGVEGELGRRRLRNMLSRIRRLCGPILVRDGEVVRLASEVWVDARAFERDARAVLAPHALGEAGAEIAAAATQHYGDGLLPYDRYLDWLSGPRERLRGLHLRLLDALAVHAEGESRSLEAVWYLERAIEMDPYEEGRYLELAMLLTRHDRPGAARRALQRGRAALAELGVPALRLQHGVHQVSA